MPPRASASVTRSMPRSLVCRTLGDPSPRRRGQRHSRPSRSRAPSARHLQDSQSRSSGRPGPLGRPAQGGTARSRVGSRNKGAAAYPEDTRRGSLSPGGVRKLKEWEEGAQVQQSAGPGPAPRVIDWTAVPQFATDQERQDFFAQREEATGRWDTAVAAARAASELDRQRGIAPVIAAAAATHVPASHATAGAGAQAQRAAEQPWAPGQEEGTGSGAPAAEQPPPPPERQQRTLGKDGAGRPFKIRTRDNVLYPGPLADAVSRKTKLWPVEEAMSEESEARADMEQRWAHNVGSRAGIAEDSVWAEVGAPIYVRDDPYPGFKIMVGDVPRDFDVGRARR